MLCPQCGEPCVQDTVDIGVGEQPVGPWGCPNCYWVAPDPREVERLIDLSEQLADPMENPALYDLAKEITHAMGATWTDPRTGQKYPPPEKPK